LIVLTTTVVLAAGIVTAILIGNAPTAVAPIVGAVFAAMIILLIGTLLQARVILTPDEIIVRGMFYRQHRPRSHVAEVVRATITAPRGGAGESLFLLDAGRGLVIRVAAGGYKREDVDLLLDALGVPCTTYDRPVEPKKFARTYPGLLSWAERHPYRLALAAVAIICATLALLVLIAALASS
jgi:hypothetical protein